MGLHLYMHFTDEDTQRHLSVFWEMQMKATFQQRPPRPAGTAEMKIDGTKCWQGCGAVGACVHFPWERNHSGRFCGRVCEREAQPGVLLLGTYLPRCGSCVMKDRSRSVFNGEK